MKKLNAKECFGERLEDVIFTDEVILEKGLSIEAYSNLIDGIYDEESSEGQSWFFQLDEDVTFGELLDMLSANGMGTIKREELTLRLIEENELQELAMAKENQYSKIK